MTTAFLHDGPADAPVTILLAHGAGGAVDSLGMNGIAAALAAEGLRVARFEFAYMAARRKGARKPPPRAETLMDEYRAAIDALDAHGKLVIGGKSMGGRVASMIADDMFAARKIGGLVCFGYPFHPPAKPAQLRTAHLETLRCPTLICQGERDPFGTRAEVEGYKLAAAIELAWLPDGDHDLKPRKKETGLAHADNLRAAAQKTRAWAARLARVTAS